jgi:hypothetical protein
MYSLLLIYYLNTFTIVYSSSGSQADNYKRYQSSNIYPTASQT